MKKILTIALTMAVIAGGAWFICSSRLPGEAHALKLKFHKGQVDKYEVHIDVAMNIPSPGTPKSSPHSVTIQSFSMMLIQSVERINPDGSAEISYTIRDMKSRSYAPWFPMGGPSGFTATIGSDGEVIKMGQSGTDALRRGGVAALILGQIFGYQMPKQPAQVGETWNGVMNIPSIGQAMTIYRLVDSNGLVKHSKAARVLGEFSYDGTDEGLAKKMRTRVTGAGTKDKINLHGTSTIYFSCSQGKVLKADTIIRYKCDLISPKFHYDYSVSVRMDKTD